MNIRKKNIWIWLIPFLIMAITLILFKTSKKWVYYGGGGRDNE